MKITYTQNRQLHKLLSDTGLTAWKVDYVVKHSNGRTSHSSELSVTEAQSIISELKEVLNGRQTAINNPNYELLLLTENQAAINKPINSPGQAEKANKLRKAIISKFITMGAVTDDGKSDMRFIQKFVFDKWKKSFNEYSVEELVKILSIVNTKLMQWYYDKKKCNPNFSIKNDA